MKRLLCIVVFVFTILSYAFAGTIRVSINGKFIDFIDANGQIVNPQILNDRTMVPFRKIFNELGVDDKDISWIQESRQVIARKGNIKITLTIGSKIAYKEINGVMETITLDTAPVIVDNRTLVPLRFIAESLEKNVDWNGSEQIAVIVDNEYDLGNLNSKSQGLCNFINNESSICKIKLTRKYYDLEDLSRNNYSRIVAEAIEDKNGSSTIQNLTLTFEGTSDLMKDIVASSCGELKFQNEFYKDVIVSKALNDGAKKISTSAQINLATKDLHIEGGFDKSLSDAIKDMDMMDKTKFTSLLNLFITSEDGTLVAKNITADNLWESYDFTKLDHYAWNSSASRALMFTNAYLLKFDIKKEELLYDYKNYSCQISANRSSLRIDLILSNIYNEKVEYELLIEK